MTPTEVKEVLKEMEDYIIFDKFGDRDIHEVVYLAIKAVELAEFIGKMLFDDWATDCNGVFPELACRRLCELGIVELNDGVYSLKRGDEE